MGVNKVMYGSETLIDLTEDTVTADKLLSGYTAHNAAGELITGTFSGGTSFALLLVNFPEGSNVTCTNTSGRKVLSSTQILFYVNAGTPPFNCVVTATYLDLVTTATIPITYEGQGTVVTLNYHVPYEYQEVEYIMATGNAYIRIPTLEINRTLVGTNTDRITRLYFEFSQDGGTNEKPLFGSYDSSRHSEIYTSSGHIQVYGYGAFGATRSLGNLVSEFSTVSFELRNSYWTYNCNGQSPSSVIQLAGSSNTGFDLFHYVGSNGTNYWGNNLQMRYFSATYADVDFRGEVVNERKAFEMYPCYRKSDNVVGMWDNVNEVFYVNNNTGASSVFEAGPDVNQL